MTGHRELRCATGPFRTQCGKPRRTLVHNRGNAGDTLGVVDCCRLPVQAEVRRERRFEAWPSLLALERFDQRRFFAADICTRADEAMNIDVDATALHVLAKQAGVVGFFHRSFETREWLVHELATHVVVRDRRTHRVSGNRHTLDEAVRVVPEDFTIVAGARFGFVRIDNEVLLAVIVLRHEAPLESCREARTTASTQP